MVSMNMQKLARYDGQLTPEQRQRCMRYAQEGAERMRLLIDDLLRYNRLDRDQTAAAPTDSTDAAHAAIENLAEVIARRGAKVTIAPLPTVRASAPQLIQLFQNLIENAIKYGPANDPRVDISASADGGAWRFSVRDNGIGIEPAYHEKIFAVFQRLHARDEYPGTGMGLAICKKIVERHGGRIWVESDAGAGATFHFTVPRS
jgi:light-regulated signal transduction histidine kinase (bacteriophytochrome)